MRYACGRTYANSVPSPIDVWCWRLDRDGLFNRSAQRLLSEQEQQRADRFRFAIHRQRFIAAHVGLRTLLADRLGRDPAALHFAVNAFGKPHLAEGGSLTFNLAHCGDVAVLAIACALPVGIDVEALRPAPHEIAAQCFSYSERQELADLDPASRDTGFFHGWTRKEAFIKAIGTGLSTPLDSFSVSLSPHAPACVRHVDGDPAEAARWQLVHLEPAPGYVAAVAARHLGWQVALHQHD